ncbi:hypothetical protein [Corynebacterium halotolerans]|uniref:Uncharacterized protein n=1 Tax=Corynebacterium halotolerans YIM 70093 = DSM 44683 TaxID=1121362 RepID=M1NMT5_9CORY|nr:hypothetical protein [Corynebacterium halotolerans]AGF72683.1 hypothetical protein A605_08405 [Corynebacterium halotolerans YIM 70093 = DSM 44683]
MSTDLKSIGLGFDRWQDAVEAAIATNQLVVTGEVRGGQLIQFTDVSGAQINILAVEPFATYAGFESLTQTFANVSMVSDVLAYCEILDPFGKVQSSVTCNLSQGPLLVDEPTQEWQQLGVTALGLEVSRYADAEAYESATGEILGVLISEGAQVVAAGSGAAAPDASATFSARVLDAEYRHNQLTGQRFIHATVDGAFPFDVCLPDSPELPARDSVIAGTAVLTASVLSPIGGGCGCGSGGCGCGGH